MTVYVTCQDITGHTREELTELCERARVRPGEPMTDDQKQAARLLLEACAAFIDARLAAPRDIRRVVAEVIMQGDDLGWVTEHAPASANSDEASTVPAIKQAGLGT